MYAAMALANGCYLSAHNLFRGLPKSAAVGNFFRSVLSIPIAVVINSAAGSILAFAGTAAVDAVLQRWAAIISKGASDLVAGVIEGTADRYVNVRLRLRDYGTKLAELFDVYARLEMLFPEDQASDLLKSAAKNGHRRNAEIRDLEKVVIVNALDMLYFWMYQPRAHTALRALIAGLSDEEREILLTSQALLQRKREVSLLLINGLVGKNFARPLAFYLGPVGKLSECHRALGGFGTAAYKRGRTCRGRRRWPGARGIAGMSRCGRGKWTEGCGIGGVVRLGVSSRLKPVDRYQGKGEPVFVTGCKKFRRGGQCGGRHL